MVISGAVHRYGDSIDTDIIIPAYLLSSRDPAFLAKHCMTPLDPEFPSRVKPGDIIVGGRNFGCGSSREHAVLALKGCGVAAIVAKSFARIFYRNAVNQGVPVVICPTVFDAAKQGETLTVDLDGGRVIVNDREFPTQPMPTMLREIIAAGGLIPYVRGRTSLGVSPGMQAQTSA
jgi:3-isopropylmalate/(R)-2-methylmalate dehydratase small subunit